MTRIRLIIQNQVYIGALMGLALVMAGCPGSGDDPVKPTPTPTPTPGTEVAVSSVTVSQAKGYLEKNGTLYLEATVKPDNATNKTVTWASSNSAVATVSSTGQVTAKAPGTAQITATAGGKTANCESLYLNRRQTCL